MTGRSGGATIDPADRVTLDESINMAFLVVLESMTPAERVAFILQEVFGYPFAEVADVVGRTPTTCRQRRLCQRRGRVDRGGEEIARVCVDFVDRAPGLTVLERVKQMWVILNPEKLRPWTTD
jgi:hypothetical protein